MNSRVKALQIALYVVLAATLFTPFIVSRTSLFPFVLPKGIFFEALTELAFILYLFLILRDKESRPRLNLVGIAVLVFFVSALASTFLGVDPSRSFWSKAERMDGLFFLAHLVVYFFILSSVLRHEEDWLRFLKLTTFVGIGLALVALFAAYVMPTSLLNVSPSASRISGTFGNPEFLGTHFLMLSFLAIIFLLRAALKRQKYLFGGLTVLFLIMLFLSGTRGAMLGFAAGFLLLWFCLALGDRRRWGKVGVIVLVTAALAVILLFAFRGELAKVHPAFKRLYEFTLESGTVRSRLIGWGIGWEAFKERPVFGWGPENFLIAYNKHFNPEITRYESAVFDRAHNRLVDVLVMQGALGILSYLFIYAAILGSLWKILRRGQTSAVWPAGIAALFAGHFVQNLFLFEMPVSSIIFFFFAAFVSWMVNATKGEESVKVVQSSPAKPEIPAYKILLASVATAAVLGASYAGVILPARAGNGVGFAVASASAIARVRPQDVRLAVVQTKNAYDSIRDRSTFLDTEIDKSEATAIVRAYDVSNSLASDADFKILVESTMKRLEEDAARHPLDYDTLIRTGAFSYSIYEQIFRNGTFGDRAIGFYEKAREISPNRSDSYEGLAYLNLVANNKQKAADIVAAELLKNPASGQLWYLKAIVDLLFGRAADTVADLNKAAEFNWPVSSDKAIAFSREFVKLGAVPKAIELYELVISRNSRDWINWKTAATEVLPLYVRSGLLDKAKDLAASLRKKTPQSEKAAVEQFLSTLSL